MRKAKCPSCKQIIALEEELRVQEHVVCPQCNSNLELVNKFPPRLAWVDRPAEPSSQQDLTKFAP